MTRIDLTVFCWLFCALLPLNGPSVYVGYIFRLHSVVCGLAMHNREVEKNATLCNRKVLRKVWCLFLSGIKSLQKYSLELKIKPLSKTLFSHCAS